MDTFPQGARLRRDPGLRCLTPTAFCASREPFRICTDFIVRRCRALHVARSPGPCVMKKPLGPGDRATFLSSLLGMGHRICYGIRTFRLVISRKGAKPQRPEKVCLCASFAPLRFLCASAPLREALPQETRRAGTNTQGLLSHATKLHPRKHGIPKSGPRQYSDFCPPRACFPVFVPKQTGKHRETQPATSRFGQMRLRRACQKRPARRE